MDPSVHQGGGGLLGVFPVAGEELRAAPKQLSGVVISRPSSSMSFTRDRYMGLPTEANFSSTTFWGTNWAGVDRLLGPASVMP